MKKSTAFYATQIIATSLAAAAAYALIPSENRLRWGQVAIITGGSRGLGLAIAHRLGKAGLKLVLAARSEDDLELARDQILRSRDVTDEDDILLIACDLTDSNQCGALIDSAIRTFGRVDVLVNNAGIIEVGAVEDQTIEAYERAMATNFFAALYLCQAVLPHMLARKSGSIVNISSIGGKLAVPHMLPYSAAKFALTGFSQGLHAEVRSKGVRVTTVCPGLMRTGGEVHAQFVGDVEKEKQWFQTAATTPLLSVTSEYAANRIFSAVNAGRAEITISPQAWLMARTAGLMPETTQFVNSLVNEYVLPAAVKAAPEPAVLHVHHNESDDEISAADPSPS
ncbi:SDR family NAD(P)-dependent oxidoreductase [Granulicella tundricola]|uniref:Short-chain dehydrogenase/reductase SDR n=1 Tax=Granulicella tundricola (strain ATCC BAA-1859 / DSM 23138 / MP5ACTX9) TaxID=1198114 RepID=E8X297_GRATM|nr:SDR family oxidoreductase [Granulicella tundricola]ADW68029.1 short-chain dehydrogenase/reductase SDR [Granulicella tundricola MP5ACTX9]